MLSICLIDESVGGRVQGERKVFGGTGLILLGMISLMREHGLIDREKKEV